VHNFKELKVWQKAVDFAVEIYAVTKVFPSEEKFGLVSQMRRAGASIPSNIAEGCGKTSTKQFSQSLEVSLGESFELETQLIIAHRTGGESFRTSTNDQWIKSFLGTTKLTGFRY
jgi:four helix bundle protein